MSTRTLSLALAAITALIGVNCAPAASSCTSEIRLAGAKQIPYSYDLSPLGASAAAFKKIPFASDCLALINANGLPAVVVGDNGNETYDFLVATRQLFSEVTPAGELTDFSNGTTVFVTNVTLGVRDELPIPVTFLARAYLTYELATCEIERIQAYATIPTQVLGLILNPPQAPSL